VSNRNPKRNVTLRVQSPDPTPEHPGATYRDTEAGTLVMLPIRAWATGPGLPCRVEYLVDLDPRRDRPQFVMVELTLRPERGEAVDTRILRAPLRIPDLVSAAVAAAMSPQHVTEESPDRYPIKQVRELVYADSGHRGRQPKIPDDQLSNVLRVWNANGGSNGGTAAVATRWTVDRTTAWRTVKRAQRQSTKKKG
jgi:hypothetical protein